VVARFGDVKIVGKWRLGSAMRKMKHGTVVFVTVVTQESESQQ
jgi:hypothetical protein